MTAPRQRFSCGLNGQCQEDPLGRYRKIESCQRECHAVEAKELQYIILGYSPEQALNLAPRDRVELVRRLTGVHVDDYDSYNILLGLGTHNLELLAQYPAIYDYLLKQYPWVHLVIPLAKSGTIEALQLLTERDALTNYNAQLALKASKFTRPVVDFLHKYVPDFLRIALSQEAEKSPVVLGYLLDLYPEQIALFFNGFFPTSTAVLDELRARGFQDRLQVWSKRVLYQDLPRPIVRWYLRYYPELRNAKNVVRALYNEAYSYLEEVADSPALGRAAANLFVEEPAIYPNWRCESSTAPDFIEKLNELCTYFHLPREDFVRWAHRIWECSMIEVLMDTEISTWVESITYLYEEAPEWDTIDDEKELANRYRAQVEEIFDLAMANWSSYTSVEQQAIRTFANFIGLTPTIRTLLVASPELLSLYPDIYISEEQVLEVLPEVTDINILEWIAEYYPNIVKKMPLLQLAILHDAQRPVPPEEGEEERTGPYEPEELLSEEY